MKTRIAVMALSGLALVAAGCSGETVATTDGGKPKKALKIASINPTAVYTEGQDIVTIKTEKGTGCGKDKVSIKVGDLTVSQIQATDLDTYTFTAPPKEVTAKQQLPLVITCSAPPDTSFEYSKNTDEGTLTYDPDLEPAPTVKTPSPQGGDVHSNGISVLAHMVVVFTREINPDTVTDRSFGISGIKGKIKASADNKTFTLEPEQQLNYATQYTCFVTTDVKSKKTNKALKPTIAPNGGTPAADKDQWTFTTRCEGCGNPWLGDISAAAGISSGGSYKLFSVTGQPTPVGEASNEQYKLQSGFIYATAPGTQQ